MPAVEEAKTMRDGVILSPKALPAYARGNGNKTIPLAGPWIGAGFLNGITVIAPGSGIALHTHNCEESVLVLEGDAFAEIGGERHALARHDASWIPADVPHRFINSSRTQPLTILWTYARPDATRTIVETGETRLVVSEHER